MVTCLVQPKRILRHFYRLQLLSNNGTPVLALSEYRPIFEQGQTRSGVILVRLLRQQIMHLVKIMFKFYLKAYLS